MAATRREFRVIVPGGHHVGFDRLPKKCLRRLLPSPLGLSEVEVSLDRRDDDVVVPDLAGPGEDARVVREKEAHVGTRGDGFQAGGLRHRVDVAVHVGRDLLVADDGSVPRGGREARQRYPGGAGVRRLADLLLDDAERVEREVVPLNASPRVVLGRPFGEEAARVREAEAAVRPREPLSIFQQLLDVRRLPEAHVGGDGQLGHLPGSSWFEEERPEDAFRFRRIEGAKAPALGRPGRPSLPADVNLVKGESGNSRLRST